MFVVAFRHPHNEGVVAGIITGPGFDTGTELVGIYEVDAEIKSFENEADARAWLTDEDSFGVPLELEAVTGGYIMIKENEDL